MDLKKTLKIFGYSTFRGSQKEIVARVLGGGHCLVLMPTGMGKSLCYQLPAILSKDLTLVISPLIALMQDQVEILLAKGIEATFINSALTGQKRKHRYKNLSKGKYKIVYITPERFRKAEFLQCLTQRTVNLLAVDEAHCISQWGHDFRPDYTRLNEIRKALKNPTTIALTATATPEVQKDIITQLNLDSEQVQIFQEGIERPNLTLKVEKLYGMPDKVQKIIDIHSEQPGNGIVYFSLIKSLEDCSNQLQQKGIKHLCYHGKQERRKRCQTQQTFMQGENNLILATNAFGLGIDKNNIRFVVHAEIPGSVESYYQEIGRAGRDGNLSLCTLLYDEQDILIHMDFIKWNNPEAELYKRVYAFVKDNLDQANSIGVNGIKNELIKNRGDFRIETVLALFDRFGVTSGSLDFKNLVICKDLPKNLADKEYLHTKELREQKMLHKMVQYTKDLGCRKAFIHQYFGLPLNTCMACDLCLSDNKSQ